MPVDEQLRALIERIGAFHITDRSLKRAQRDMQTAIGADHLDERASAVYVELVRRYFQRFRDEARTHLRDVDRRLEQVNQVHFNLTAERGVAVKRIEATQSVLEALADLGPGAR